LLSIKSFRTAANDEWDQIWINCYYATYFHSREWAEIWEKYTKSMMSPYPIIISFSDAKKALIPFSIEKKLHGICKTYVSSPAGTFGGWISSDNLDLNHAELLKNFIFRNFNSLIWRINPYDELANKLRLKPAITDETQRLDLRNSFDEIIKIWRGKKHPIQTKVRKAEKEGVSIKKADTMKCWKEYYSIYLNSVKRWGDEGSSFYSWSLFEEMYNLNSDYIKLWLAFYNSRIICGALCLYAGKNAVYWHGAALNDYFYLRPVNLLMYEIVKDACLKKYDWFDFNPSGGHEGVKAFKKSFGTQPSASNVIERKTFVNRTASLILKYF
jgi:hypothetical protein